MVRVHTSMWGLALSIVLGCGGEAAPAGGSTTADDVTGGPDLAQCQADLQPRGPVNVCGDADTSWASWQVEGLMGCTEIPGQLHLSDDAELVDLRLFSELRAVGRLTFFRNEQMTSVDGLENLVVAGTLGLHYLPVLTDVTALGRLCEVTDELYVSQQSVLTNLEGMERVHTVGSLRIQNNPELASLAGLSGLRTIEGDLVIENNPSLPQADAEAFAERLTIGGEILIADNG